MQGWDESGVALRCWAQAEMCKGTDFQPRVITGVVAKESPSPHTEGGRKDVSGQNPSQSGFFGKHLWLKCNLVAGVIDF